MHGNSLHFANLALLGRVSEEISRFYDDSTIRSLPALVDLFVISHVSEGGLDWLGDRLGWSEVPIVASLLEPVFLRNSHWKFASFLEWVPCRY